MLHKLTMYRIENGRNGVRKPAKAVTFYSSCNLMGGSSLGGQGVGEEEGGLYRNYLVKISALARSKQYLINNFP